MIFRYTTAIHKIRKMTKRKKVIQGGSSAGKTGAVIAILIDMCTLNPGLEVSVVSQSIPHLKRGAYKDFIKIMKATGRYVPGRLNETSMKYTFHNGAYIEFFSVEDEQKILGARRHVLYVNEANRIKFDTYHQLASRTERDIFIDFNPTKKFWAHTEVASADDAELIILTYMDNEARPANVDEEMAQAKANHDRGTSSYWVNWWKVYGLGQIGALEGVVWSDWSVIKKLPSRELEDGTIIHPELLGFGVDFGFSNSPTAVIAVYRWEGRYIFDEWVYDTGLFNRDIAYLMTSQGYRGEMMYCDYESPQSIAELHREGLNTFPCASKSDIREYAIGKVARDHFYVTERSTGLIGNLENYMWAEDKTGAKLNKPKKQDDHGPDAIIYFVGTEDKYDGTY